MSKMISLIFLFCQTNYHVEQGGPKCIKEKENTYFRSSDFVHLTPMFYILCDNHYLYETEYIFDKCHSKKVNHKGCSIGININKKIEYYDVSNSCKNISEKIK